MSAAREAILGAVRRAVQANPERPVHPGRAPVPAGGAAPVDRFVAKAEKAAATVERLARPTDLPAAVAAYAQAHGLASRLVAAPHPMLRALPWPDTLRPEFGSAGAQHPLGLTVAEYGIAETGSLVLLAGPETPTGLNLLPDHLLCVLPAERILPCPEAFWAHWRTAGGAMPRAVNFITGPSRTADVEQKMQLGAHGPRSLLILLI